MSNQTQLGAALLGLALVVGTARAQDSRPTTEPAPRKASEFTLTDLDGKKHTLSEYTKAGKVVVLEWFNPDCPFVKKHHKANKTMAKTFAKYKKKDVVWIAINSGSPGKQGTGVERNKKAVKDYGIAYPLCLDEDGKVGRAYKAKVTPHMFVIDKSGNIVYEGAIDDNRAGKELGATNYVAVALEAVLAGKPVKDAVTRPYGCSVKYGKARN